MSALIPFAVVLLALAAAGFIAWIAWDLTSKETQDVLERALGQKASGTDDASPPDQPFPAGGQSVQEPKEPL
ncbi:MAG TPA: hypothetical protein VFY03_13125 [Woeseiaceae bacterium]|nr:hypothetical protein [Woeseiaceae bacterium]